MSRRLYAVHRWIAALASIQLGVWTLSGLYFAVVPIARVRGAGVQGAHERPLGPAPGAVTSTTALACFASLGMSNATRLELQATPAGLFYVAHADGHALRIDARSCASAPVTQPEAEATASRDRPGAPGVLGAELLAVAPLEYRSKPLPAWRVVLADDEGTVVYIDAATGEVTARRNDTWRTYDFLWGLHIMDYSGREGFNHPLLVAAAALGLLTVASGGALWTVRLRRRLRSRSMRAGRASGLAG